MENKKSVTKFLHIPTGIRNTILIMIQLCILAITIYVVYEGTPIYGVEKISYYEQDLEAEKKLNDKLMTGKYIVLYHRELNITSPKGDKYVYMLGKIKK